MEKISHRWNISIPLLQKILSILVPKDSDVSFVHEVKNAIRYDLEKRYQNEEVKCMLRIASFLDPRLKHLPFLTDSEWKDIKSSAIFELTQFIEEMQTSDMSQENRSLPAVPSCSLEEQPPALKKKQKS